MYPVYRAINAELWINWSNIFWVKCVLFTWSKRDDWWVGWQECHWAASMGGSSKECAWGESLFAHLALSHSFAKECAHQPGPTLCTHVSWQKLPSIKASTKFTFVCSFCSPHICQNPKHCENTLTGQRKILLNEKLGWFWLFLIRRVLLSSVKGSFGNI